MHNETWYDRAGGELVLSVRDKPNNAWGSASAAPIYKDGQGHVMQTPGRDFLVHPKTKKQYWRTREGADTRRFLDDRVALRP